MRVAVVTFLGSNCDEDSAHVFENLLGIDVDRVWYEATELPAGTDVVVLPGGFSYGDALRSGALARFAPVMKAVAAFAERGGFVLGICNGFQILLEAGLLPGAMRQNDVRTFVCRSVPLEVVSNTSAFTSRYAAGQMINIPVAHHEGSYYADEATLAELEAEGRVAFRYTTDNPNGSRNNIAGIFNKSGNVLGMMPHPERAAEAILQSEDGLPLFQSIVDAVKGQS